MFNQIQMRRRYLITSKKSKLLVVLIKFTIKRRSIRKLSEAKQSFYCALSISQQSYYICFLCQLFSKLPINISLFVFQTWHTFVLLLFKTPTYYQAVYF